MWVLRCSRDANVVVSKKITFNVFLMKMEKWDELVPYSIDNQYRSLCKEGKR